MTDQEKRYQLIVRQLPDATEPLEQVLKVLHGDYGLDAYTARQRLLGPGLAMLGQGGLEQTGKIAGLLQKHGLDCWLVEVRRPGFAPDQLRSLEISSERIRLLCRTSEVLLERGAAVVAVLGDISGELGNRYVKRAMAQNTYRGHVSAAALPLKETLRAIYQGKPVFDFYLRDENGQLAQGVRVFPGKFNHTGLGERAGLSAVQNLDTLRCLVEEYAGDYRLHTDFGLGYLPGCPVDKAEELIRRANPASFGSAAADGAAASATILRDNPALLNDNLNSLTRYGWLVAQLEGPGRPPATGEPGPVSVAAGLAAALLVGQPAMGAVFGSDGARTLPGVGDLASEIEQAIGEPQQEDSGRSRPDQTAPRDLPAPPERPPRPFSLKQPLAFLGSIVAALSLVWLGDGRELLDLLAGRGVSSGLVPGVVGLICLWGGFYFFALKRRVENTPTSKIRSIAMGLVEVHGRACRQYALVAPMTQSACVWYRLRKYRKDQRNNWRKVKEIDSGHVPFLIDDGTGKVTVAPRRAAVTARIRQTGYPGEGSLTFTAFAGRAGDNEKWIEDLIYEGTSLYVLGYAHPLRSERPSLRERTLDRLRQLKLDRNALHRYDANGDGRIDEEEWETARADAEQQALREHLGENAERRRQEEHVVISHAPQPGLPFVIAEVVSEADLVRKYTWISAPLLVIGTGAAVFAVYRLAQLL